MPPVPGAMQLKLRALAADNARLRRELLASQQHAGGHGRVDQTGRSADAARIQLLEATVASLQGEQRPREGASLNGRTTEDQVREARLSRVITDEL